MPADALARMLAGIALLAFGKSLFWLFVAVLGFAAALDVASGWLTDQTALVRMVFALACGLAGALLAIFLQRLTIAVAGFVAVGQVVAIAGRQLGWAGTDFGWALIVISGILGALVLVLLFDAALIVLSSVVGAAITAEALPFEPILQAVVFVALTLIGILVQTRMTGSQRPERPGGRPPPEGRSATGLR